MENARSGADLIFWHLSGLREEAGCCCLGAFGAISFGGNSFGGNAGRGMHLNSQSTGADFLPREYWFPWQRKSPAPKVLTGRLGLAWDAPLQLSEAKASLSACPSSELGERGIKVPALQKYSHCSPSLPNPGACASGYSSLDSSLSKVLWLSR